MLKYINGRWQGRAVTRAIRHYEALEARDRAKVPAEALQTGGWEIMSGNPAYQKANEIWHDKQIKELEGAYGAQLVVYACVKKICLSAQEAPLKIGIQKPRGWIDKPQHPMAGLLSEPNPDMHYGEFQWHGLAHLLLTGKSHVWKWRNGLGEVAEMWPMPSSFVRAVRSDAGRVVGYSVFQGQGKDWLPVPKADMIRCILPDPSCIGEGLGPLQAALHDVQTDDERSDYMIEMLTNTRAPGMIFKQPDDWSPEQVTEMRALINGGLGRGRRGRTLFLSGDGVTMEQTAPMKDFHWDALAKFTESRICAAFGVPPMLVHLSSGNEASTLANYEMARRTFFQDTMQPLWSLLDYSMTKGLLRDEGDSSNECYHDTDDVRALREDADKIAERATKLLAAGLITRNKALEMIGEDPVDAARGDVYLMPMNLTEVPAAGPLETPADNPDEGNDANADL